MAHRKIEDPQQTVWDVWDVVPARVTSILGEDRVGAAVPRDIPHGPRRLLVPTEMQSGWLAFQSEKESRRLAPVPADWESLPAEALLQLLAEAPVVKPRRPRIVDHS